MNQSTESRTDGRDNNQLRVRMLRLAEVAHLTGLGTTTIYGLQALGDFPQSLPMPERAVRWIESEIEAWLSLHTTCRSNRAAVHSALARSTSVGRRLKRGPRSAK
jgi:prophage regulatory protein